MATQRYSWAAVSLCWILSAVLSFTPLLGWNNFHSDPLNSTSASSSALGSPPCTFLSVVSLPFMVYFNFLGCVLTPPAGHNTPICTDLLEPAGPSAGQLPPGSGLTAQGKETGLLPVSGAHIVYRLLDPFALDELCVAVCWSRRRSPGGSVHRYASEASCFVCLFFFSSAHLF